MSQGGVLSGRALVLAPSGRDGALAAAILGEVKIPTLVCLDLDGLLEAMEQGAGLAVIVDEALRNADLSTLSRWIENQPSWSDFPFLLLTQRGG